MSVELVYFPHQGELFVFGRKEGRKEKRTLSGPLIDFRYDTINCFFFFFFLVIR